MKYDFTSLMDRHGMDAIAVDAVGAPGFSITAPKEGFDVIPMWIADMNFPTVPTIAEAIVARTQHTAYGYFSPRAEYYDAIIQWHKDHNGVEGLATDLNAPADPGLLPLQQGTIAKLLEQTKDMNDGFDEYIVSLSVANQITDMMQVAVYGEYTFDTAHRGSQNGTDVKAELGVRLNVEF